jgi:ABC-2 type transport system permease protein
MDTVITASAVLPAASRTAMTATLRIFLLEARSEFLRLLRAPGFCVPTIAFPLMFYLLFGVLLAGHGQSARRALAAFLVIGTMAPGLFALGITLAVDRERGLLQLKRALPMPAGTYLAAKMAMSMAFAAIVATLLMLTGAFAGGVVLSLSQWSLLLALAVVAVLPFCAIGLLVGGWVKASAAPAVLNLIYLPMSLLSGLWVPLAYLPHGIGQIAPLWPAWHLAQLATAVVDAAPSAGLATHLLTLAAVTAVCFALARRRLARPR